MKRSTPKNSTVVASDAMQDAVIRYALEVAKNFQDFGIADMQVKVRWKSGMMVISSYKGNAIELYRERQAEEKTAQE